MFKRLFIYLFFSGILCSFYLVSDNILQIPFLQLSTGLFAAEKSDQQDLRTAIIKVANQAIPAVVHIEVTQTREVANPTLPFDEDPFFRRFFGAPRNTPKKFKQESKGIGTGMIIDTKGHILTNNHVVAGADKIEVMTADGEKYDARVVGTDPKTDLAVIKISAKNAIPFLSFGDSDKVDVGEWVVAIGHPRGLDQTVTQGIISAKHRTGIVDPNAYQDYLQTDAAINPGNSGGPLLNLNGEVIGINAVIVSESGGFEGIGFAIPSNMAAYIAKLLISNGKIRRGWLAVSIQDITPELVKSMKLGSIRGAYVADIVKGGPAEKGGLEKGDIVVEYQGKTINNSSFFRNEVASSAIGQEAKIIVLRNGKKIELNVKIGNLEDSSKILSASIKERMGGEFRLPTEKEAEKYGLEPGLGVVLSKIESTGPLADIGFDQGDMILEINNQPVAGIDGLSSILGAIKPGQKIAALALDHKSGDSGFVQITVK